MLRTCLVVFFALSLSLPGLAQSCSQHPYKTLQPITEKIFSPTPNTSLSYLKSNVLPMIDIEYMAKYVVGRYHWKGANESHKKAFLQEYELAIERAYDGFMKKNNVNNLTLSLKKHLSSIDTDQAIIFGTVSQPSKGKKIIGIYFHCQDNKWKIYDLSYDNLHLLEQLKLQYASIVRHQGLKGLTNELKKIK